MKIALDPMPAERARAVNKVNAYFNSLARPHLDAAHAMKRQVASEPISGAPAWFIQEADMRGITPTDLADLVLSKPDTLAERELARQCALRAIDAARTPADLSRVVDKALVT